MLLLVVLAAGSTLLRDVPWVTPAMWGAATTFGKPKIGELEVRRFLTEHVRAGTSDPTKAARGVGLTVFITIESRFYAAKDWPGRSA